MKHDDRGRPSPPAGAAPSPESRRLAVAHPVPGVCGYCDDLYDRLRAAFRAELAEEVRSSHFMQAAALAAQLSERSRE